MALSRQNRLSSREFPRILRQKNRITNGSITLKWKGTSVNSPRLGIIIPAKKFPKATTRNTLKRRIVEIIRDKLEQIAPRLDILIIVNNSGYTESNQNLITDTGKALDKLKHNIKTQVLNMKSILRYE